MKRFDKILTDIQKVLLSHKIYSDEMENETPETELMEYKSESLEMSLGSLKKILNNVSDILNNSDLDRVKENLTEPWVQGMIAVVDDNISTIHDFVKYVPSDDDKSVAGCGCGGNKKQPPKDFKAKVSDEKPDTPQVRIAPVKETEAEIEKKE